VGASVFKNRVCCRQDFISNSDDALGLRSQFSVSVSDHNFLTLGCNVTVPFLLSNKAIHSIFLYIKVTKFCFSNNN
jgi:hypothetical protein